MSIKVYNLKWVADSEDDLDVIADLLHDAADELQHLSLQGWTVSDPVVDGVLRLEAP